MSKSKLNLNIDAEVPDKSSENICSKCKKGKLVTTVRTRGGWLGKEIFTSFCPICGHTIREES